MLRNECLLHTDEWHLEIRKTHFQLKSAGINAIHSFKERLIKVDFMATSRELIKNEIVALNKMFIWVRRCGGSLHVHRLLISKRLMSFQGCSFRVSPTSRLFPSGILQITE